MKPSPRRFLAGPETDGERARTVVGTFVLHLRPVRVPAAAIRFTHAFGLGAPARLYMNVERAYREFRNEPADAPWTMTATFDAVYEVAKARGCEVEF